MRPTRFRRAVLPLLALLLLAALRPAAAYETVARAAILLDAQTGEVLFAKNPDEPLPPASMSKLMTALMVFERLKAGTLKLDDTLPVSERAWRTGGSKMFVHVGDRVRVDDLLRGIIIQSGNDACTVVAEAIAGTEEAFADQMTVRAREIGLTHSAFKNASGLDDPGHFMSVRDLTTVARRIIVEHPDSFKFYGEREFTYAGIKQPNRNPLLQANVPGVDGMKTGHTSVAGYGLVATAQRDGRRLLLAVTGLESERQRRSESERLLEHGFRDFQEYRLFAPGETVAEVGVWLGEAAKVAATPAQPVAVTLSREARKSLAVTLHYNEPVPAPVAPGQPLGEVEIRADGMEPRRQPLVAATAVERAGVLGRVTGAVEHLVFGGG